MIDKMYRHMELRAIYKRQLTELLTKIQENNVAINRINTQLWHGHTCPLKNPEKDPNVVK